jgi:LmbE family N-acetylglucosaminyl deacetylase
VPPTYPVVTPPGPVGGGDELRFRPWSDSRAGGILFVLAHPDDETFLCGGTIARYAAAGIPVHCLCATRGECGTIAPELRRDRPVADVRLAELAGAARALGLDAVSFLGYRDSGMPGSPDTGHPGAFINASLAECSERIALHIRALRPRIVVTHGPYGEYGHPDHIRLHEATLLAFRVAGDKTTLPESVPWSPDALFVTVFDTRLVRFAVRVLRLLRRDPQRFGERADVDLVAIADNAPPTTCVVDVGGWLATRDRATRHHRSQLGERRYLLMLPRVVRRWFGPTESYARVIPPHHPDDPQYRDLIEAARAGRAGTADASSARLAP